MICLVGGVCYGAIGAQFSFGVDCVTKIRINHGFLIYFLPLGGILSVAIYKILRVEGLGTDHVLTAAGGKAEVSPKLTPAIFTASLLSHLFGASVGREGAALQLGGSLACFFGRIFKLDQDGMRVITYGGMAGLFSAVFGTPFAAFLFALEVAFVGKIYLKAVLPTFMTSFVAFFTANILGAHPERFLIESLPRPSVPLIFETVLIAVAAALLSVAFCYALKGSKWLFKKLFERQILRIVVGGSIIVLLTLVVGTRDYNGAGINVIERIFSGEEIAAGAFLIKLIFTAITVSSGFKGGEIIPTLFIGAAFGAFLASLFGLSVPLCALIGLTAIFCGATNCMFASMALALELFSGKGAVFIIIAAVVSFFISGKISLYSEQKHSENKFNFPYTFE